MIESALTLRCFLAVAETGNFTEAAKKVGRTQSAVSQQIAKLEQQLETRLFIRAKRLQLTSEGEVLLTYARKIIQLNQEAVAHFKEPELHGVVRFGLPEDFASVFLSEVLTEYAITHPHITLHIECDLTLNLFERFKQNAFDLVLLKMNRPEDFPNGLDVWSEALEWVGNRDFFKLDPEQTIPLVLSPAPCVYHARAIGALNQKLLKWQMVFSSDSYAGKIAAVKAGMGITVLPKNMIPESLKIITSDPLLPVLEDTHISLLKHTENSLVVDSFERFVIHHLQH